ncbi:threonine-phosphate decarboxylase CobD [Neobacillus sp. PS3-12]|uniref:threonine-phosphate decarboxylase CobD n=1 Tax=Neobacillus sp. PS3-12 TaxID=3070677 RepID=UPI0027DFCB1B|nr:threonine-phosphate decarboxylase CobD [Neobacillus sp. PS3-12]WML51158.1 threonine-phosphate decarboxylase CobD [Neobacillus sp. PS3-12]
MKWPSHGSNPQYLYEAMGMMLPENYLDFSANINPLGPPEALKKSWNEIYKKVTVYPDPYALALKGKLSKKEQIPIDSLLVGNGGAELITLLARMLEGKKVLLIQPTFSEYEQACRVNRCEIMTYQLEAPDFELSLERIRPKLRDADAMFFCNPNNPTGIRYLKSDILMLLEECEKNDCLFILDEAFYDFLLDYQSYIPYIKRFSNLIIIRSMTKMFAIPGIRLGYLVGHPEMIANLQSIQSHWSINAIALAAGELCMDEKAFIKQTQNLIANERNKLFTYYRQQEFTISASEVNFYLLKDPYLKDQFSLFEFLLKKGVIPRHTFNFPGLEGKWLRFAIRSSQENQQLMEVLKEWRKLHR